MRRILTVVALTMALILSQAVAAQMKIAVVDVNEAIGQTSEAREFLRQVQDEMRPEQDRIRELTAERARIEEEAERDQDILDERGLRRLQEEYERLSSDLQFRAERYQQTLQRRRNELMREMGPRVQAALDEMVRAEGYDLVIPAGAVIYVDPSHDITRRLTERLDRN